MESRFAVPGWVASPHAKQNFSRLTNKVKQHTEVYYLKWHALQVLTCPEKSALRSA